MYNQNKLTSYQRDSNNYIQGRNSVSNFQNIKYPNQFRTYTSNKFQSTSKQFGQQEVQNNTDKDQLIKVLEQENKDLRRQIERYQDFQNICQSDTEHHLYRVQNLYNLEQDLSKAQKELLDMDPSKKGIAQKLLSKDKDIKMLRKEIQQIKLLHNNQMRAFKDRKEEEIQELKREIEFLQDENQELKQSSQNSYQNTQPNSQIDNNKLSTMSMQDKINYYEKEVQLYQGDVYLRDQEIAKLKLINQQLQNNLTTHAINNQNNTQLINSLQLNGNTNKMNQINAIPTCSCDQCLLQKQNTIMKQIILFKNQLPNKISFQYKKVLQYKK